MSITLQPVKRIDRIALLDILRGFAILGIFIANLYSLSFYWALTDVQKQQLYLSAFDQRMDFLHTVFIEGKFYSLFSMLFGIGFAIYLNKADESGKVLNTFRRRLAVLLLIGLSHLLLWSGDIVALYAMLGFILIPFRRFTNKTLLILAVVFILSPILCYALKMNWPDIFNFAKWPRKMGIYMDEKAGIVSEEDYVKVARGSNFAKMLQVNMGGIFFRYADLLFQSRIWKVLGMFFIGLVIGRKQLYYKLQENKKLLWIVFVCGIVIGIPANYLFAHYKELDGYYQLQANGMKQTIAYAFGVAPLALAYASAFALMYTNKTLRKILNVTAPVGRMALTNYITHTLIGLFVFTQLGMGVYGMGPTQWTMFAVCVYLAQIIISTIWLRFFNFGPLEWVWRSATYGRLQPFIKRNIAESSVNI